MHFQSRVSANSVHKLLFTGDGACYSTTEGDIQRRKDHFAAACDNFDVAINTEKTMVMHQPPPDAAYVAPQINVNGAQLPASDNFIYMGSTLSHNTKIDDELLSPTDIEAEVAGPDTGHLEQTGILNIYAMLGQLQLRWGGHLVRISNERLSKQFFYGDVAMGSRRQGGHVRRYKTSLKCLQINPTN
ncbi:hypothetical protein SprV_0100137100 [Sparganum proliferum]